MEVGRNLGYIGRLIIAYHDRPPDCKAGGHNGPTPWSGQSHPKSALYIDNLWYSRRVPTCLTAEKESRMSQPRQTDHSSTFPPRFPQDLGHGAGRHDPAQRHCRPRLCRRGQHDQNRPGRLRRARHWRRGPGPEHARPHTTVGRRRRFRQPAPIQPPQPRQATRQAGGGPARSAIHRHGRLPEGHRHARSGQRCHPGHAAGLPADPSGIRGPEGNERLHGEVVRRRCPRHPPRDPRRSGGRQEKPQNRRRPDEPPLQTTGRYHRADPQRGHRRSDHLLGLPRARPRGLSPKRPTRANWPIKSTTTATSPGSTAASCWIG